MFYREVVHATLDNLDRTDTLEYQPVITGDLVVMIVLHKLGPRLPAGFVQVASLSSTAGRTLMGWKVATSFDEQAMRTHQFVTIPAYNPLQPSTLLTGGGGYCVFTFPAGSFDPSDPIATVMSAVDDSAPPGTGGWATDAWHETYHWSFIDYRHFKDASGAFVGWNGAMVPKVYPAGDTVFSELTDGNWINSDYSITATDPDSQSTLSVAYSYEDSGHYVTEYTSSLIEGQVHIGFEVRLAPGTALLPPVGDAPPAVGAPSDKASERFYSSVGIEPVLVDKAEQGVMLSQGIELAVDDDDSFGMFASVGIELVSGDGAYGQLYAGEVDDSAPIPHVWGVWRKTGLIGDHVTVVGHGFHHAYYRDPMFPAQGIENNAVFYKIGNSRGNTSPVPGTQFLIGGGSSEINPASLNPAEISFDGALTIEGVEYVAWDVVIPEDVAPSDGAGAGPWMDYLGIKNPPSSPYAAESNWAPWLLQPLVPTALANSPTGNRGRSLVRVIAEPVVAYRIPQTQDLILLESHMVSGGNAERMPSMSAFSQTGASIGTWSAEAYLDPWDTQSDEFAGGANARWLPVDSTVVAHPELGTGVSLWVPWNGSVGSPLRWRMQGAQAPYIDPVYVVGANGSEDLIKPAMVFGGAQKLDLQVPLPEPDLTINAPMQFSVALALSISKGGIILQSKPDVEPTDNVDLVLDAKSSDYFDFRLGGPGSGQFITVSGGDVVTVLVITVSGNSAKAFYSSGTMQSTEFFAPSAIAQEGLRLSIGGPPLGIPSTAFADFRLFEVQVYDHALGAVAAADEVETLRSRYGGGRFF